MKKPRRVMVVLELETTAKLPVLKNRWLWQRAWNQRTHLYKAEVADISVAQVSVNVVEKKAKAKK